MRAARTWLFDRYEVPVRSYLVGALRDEDAAEECFQEFAVRLFRGDFKRASPEVGSFRKYLKTSLLNLVRDHQRKRQRRGLPFSSDTPEPLSEPLPPDDADREFETKLRDAMIVRTLKALEEHDERSRQHLYTVLRLRMDQPEMTSDQMAEHLSVALGKSLNAQWVRKRLYHARQKFEVLLLDDVASSLEVPTFENLEEELRDLGLLDRCRSALRAIWFVTGVAGPCPCR